MLPRLGSNRPGKIRAGGQEPEGLSLGGILPTASPFILAGIIDPVEKKHEDALQERLAQAIAAFQAIPDAVTQDIYASWRSFWLDAAELAAYRACGLETDLGEEIVDRALQCIEAGEIPWEEQRMFHRVILYTADRKWDAMFDTLWQASSATLHRTAHCKEAHQAIISAVGPILQAFNQGSPALARREMAAYLNLFTSGGPGTC
jgi:DNA-binding FadR family transcriptional regulator